jgi:hypothetical protein
LKVLSFNSTDLILGHFAQSNFILPSLEHLILTDVVEDDEVAYVPELAACFPVLRKLTIVSHPGEEELMIPHQFLVDVVPTKFPFLETLELNDWFIKPETCFMIAKKLAENKERRQRIEFRCESSVEFEPFSPKLQGLFNEVTSMDLFDVQWAVKESGGFVFSLRSRNKPETV